MYLLAIADLTCFPCLPRIVFGACCHFCKGTWKAFPVSAISFLHSSSPSSSFLPYSPSTGNFYLVALLNLELLCHLCCSRKRAPRLALRRPTEEAPSPPPIPNRIRPFPPLFPPPFSRDGLLILLITQHGVFVCMMGEREKIRYQVTLNS